MLGVACLLVFTRDARPWFASQTAAMKTSLAGFRMSFSLTNILEADVPRSSA